MFVLITFRPGSQIDKSHIIRFLVYIWLAQNVLLVISSMLRLELYISVYHLTYWRISAFIWMGLVASGLILIVTRIALSKSNNWLLSRNFAILVLTLYVCSFINFDYAIANYNLENYKNKKNPSLNIDTQYICKLSPNAIPTIDRYLKETGQDNCKETDHYTCRFIGRKLNACRAQMEWQHNNQMSNWRGWSYRGAWLSWYLQNKDKKISDESKN